MSYDTAQICENGHLINSSSEQDPGNNKEYCDICGAKTISACKNCNKNIQGYYSPDDRMGTSYAPEVPAFCMYCGKPFPWTELRIKSAQELAMEMDGATPEERELLSKSIDDIVRDTPRTALAAIRFKKIAAKGGKIIAEGFRDILVDVLSETAKKIIWP